MNNKGFALVGHLQVMGEPLSSLYVDRQTDMYYLTVRSFVNIGIQTYVMSQVKPTIVVAYMNRQIGLHTIFETNPVFEYKRVAGQKLRVEDIRPVHRGKAFELLDNNAMDDCFDESLAYKSFSLKNYLIKKSNTSCHV